MASNQVKPVTGSRPRMEGWGHSSAMTASYWSCVTSYLLIRKKTVRTPNGDSVSDPARYARLMYSE